MKNPRNREEWQEAVDLADAMLRVHSARCYGLITGGPEVCIERCEKILAMGKELGLAPRKEVLDRLVGELIK